MTEVAAQIHRGGFRQVDEEGLVARRATWKIPHGVLSSLWQKLRRRSNVTEDLLDSWAVTTTMVYTHVLNRGALGVRSPFDRL